MKYSLPPFWESFKFSHEEVERTVEEVPGSYQGLSKEALYTSSEDLLEIFSSSLVAGTFCDLGCGTGHASILYASIFPDRASIGVEFTQGRIETGKKFITDHHIKNVELITADLIGCPIPASDTYFLYFPTGPVLDRILSELYNCGRFFRLVVVESHGDLYSRLDLENWLLLKEKIPLKTPRHADHARIYERTTSIRSEKLEPFNLSFRETFLLVSDPAGDWIGETRGLEWTEGDRFELLVPPRTISWKDVKKLMVHDELEPEILTSVNIRRLGIVTIETREKIYEGYIRKILVSPTFRLEISSGEQVEWKDILNIRKGSHLCFVYSRPS